MQQYDKYFWILRVSFFSLCMHSRDIGITVFKVLMRKPGDFGTFYFVFSEVSLGFSCGQTSNLSISAFPAVGVAWESSPESPDWSHAGRRGVSVLCQRLTWCSAEGLLVSTLSLLSPSFLFFPKFEIWRTQWVVKKRNCFTQKLPHRGLNSLRDMQTPIVCKGMKITFLTVCMY